MPLVSFSGCVFSYIFRPSSLPALILSLAVRVKKKGRPGSKANHNLKLSFAPTSYVTSSNLLRVVIDGGALHGANIKGSIDRPRKRACWGDNRPTSCPWRHGRTIACCH